MGTEADRGPVDDREPDIDRGPVDDREPDIFVNNHATLVVNESFAAGKRIKVNNGGVLVIKEDR